MTSVEKMAAFVGGVMDVDVSVGCAIGASGSEIASEPRAHAEEFGIEGRCTLVGGARSARNRAAFCNGALVRYLDFTASYLAKDETCHPRGVLLYGP